MNTKISDSVILALFLRARNADRFPHVLAADVAAFNTASARCDSLSVSLCNCDIDGEQYDKRTAAIKAKLDPMLALYGLQAVTTGDPRGYCLHLLPADGAAPVKGNTWGGDNAGYGV